MSSGRLASRAIQDWLAGHLSDGFREWRCSSLRDPSRHFANSGPDHDLIIIPTQTYDRSGDIDGNGHILISSMCRFCRYHFVFKITPGQCGRTTENPMHHYTRKSAEYIPGVVAEGDGMTPVKRYPMEARVLYGCSVCPQTVTVEISLPRLKNEWLRLISDEDRVRNALEAAKAREPDRFADCTAERDHKWITGAMATLNTYIRNILDYDGSSAPKRISFSNKIFSVQFGQPCEPIFRYLGFRDVYDGDRDETFWHPPQLPPAVGKSPLGSERAFYEDARSEVQSFLDENPPQNEPVVIPISSARQQLESALGCRNIDADLAKPILDDEAQDLLTVGAPADADDDLLKYAYTRQVDVNPQNKNVYLDALGRLAQRRDEALQMFVFSQREEQAKPQEENQIDKAYGHFGLDKWCREDPQYFINVYRTYREQSPAQKAAHRAALLQIGKNRNSDAILAEVYKVKMEPAEAYSFLSADKMWPMDNIAASAQTLLDELDLDLVIMALDAISLDRPSNDPSRSGFEAIVSAIRSQRNVTDQVMTDADKPANEEAVSMDLPVGLGNLRNTCYLNSILQYFYSVKAVRNLALDLERPPLEPTEQNLELLLSGTESSELETGRAFVGHEFARELHTLFRELETSKDSSVTPRQRLANAALLRPEKMRPQLEPVATVAGPSNSEAPPLPPRAGENSEPKMAIDSLIELPSETASNVSSQTLVGQTDEDPSYVVVERDAAKSADASYPRAPLDVEMTDAHKAPPKTTEAGEADAKQSKLRVEELASELDKPNVGSDQMDVDEVMGNAIDHLRAAFKVAHIGRADAVPDPIEEAFFSKFIDNRKKVGEPNWTRSTRRDRWVTAYPAKSGSRDIYQALGNSFDLETLPGDLLSFTTIEKPAPNFHICIQRSDGVRKNANPIEIPDVLYLDRFMHSRDGDIVSMKAKKRGWDIDTRLNEIKQGRENKAENKESKRQSETAPTNFVQLKPNKDESNGTSVSAEDIEAFIAMEHSDAPMQSQDEGWSILSPSIKDMFARHNVDLPAGAKAVSPSLAPIDEETKKTLDTPQQTINDFWAKFAAAEDKEMEELEAKRKELFQNMKEVEYRLHAVVCHAGSTASAGHYWVWIHDFEQGVWRKYNDTRVSVHDAEYVFHELSTKGEPYYLAYVRAKDIPELVNVPRRQGASAQVWAQSEGIAIDPMLRGGAGDQLGGQERPISINSKDAHMAKHDDDYEKPVVEYVDDVKMGEYSREE